MDRSSILRLVLLATAIFLFWRFGPEALTGGSDKASELPPWVALHDWSQPKGDKPKEEFCDLSGNRFKAQFGSYGATLTHAWMEGDKYTTKKAGKVVPIDLVTVAPQHLSRRALRTNFRTLYEGDEQVEYDDFAWRLDKANSTDKRCVFTYQDERVALEKRITVSQRPFELKVDVKVTNRAAQAYKHRFSIEQSDWRKTKETKSKLGRTSEFHTLVEARVAGETERDDTGDFDVKDFDDEEFSSEKWRRYSGDVKWVAVSSSYFSKAVLPVEGATKPAAETRIEEWWASKKYKDKKKDPDYGHVYRARLAYDAKELQPNESASYTTLAFVGPKERAVLGEVGGGSYEMTELLDLGMFGVIGKLLIQYLYILYGLVGTWGWAICLLTITVKVLLFPLSITQIKSSYAMRKLKPYMDEINEKYKDDATQRGLATQELWRKKKVTNPMLGCLPVVFQMPVWFALYRSLNTAVELYHTPFGPFIPDLSAPGLYYIIPALLGASSFLQQRIMPTQGDAMQQKMMRWMMPAIFTVMMLFLPAGLGIYFLTNTWLGIAQQLGVERYYRMRDERDGESTENDDVDPGDEDEDEDAEAFGKGKARAQQRG